MIIKVLGKDFCDLVVTHVLTIVFRFGFGEPLAHIFFGLFCTFLQIGAFSLLLLFLEVVFTMEPISNVFKSVEKIMESPQTSKYTEAEHDEKRYRTEILLELSKSTFAYRHW